MMTSMTRTPSDIEVRLSESRRISPEIRDIRCMKPARVTDGENPVTAINMIMNAIVNVELSLGENFNCLSTPDNVKVRRLMCRPETASRCAIPVARKFSIMLSSR